MDLMVISPATEKTSRTYSLNSFTLITLPSNLIFLLSNFQQLHVSFLSTSTMEIGVVAEMLSRVYMPVLGCYDVVIGCGGILQIGCDATRDGKAVLHRQCPCTKVILHIDDYQCLCPGLLRSGVTIATTRAY